MTKQAIEHREHGDRGGWFIEKDGHRVAEMTYARDGKVLVMNHSWVDVPDRGQGVARELLDTAVRYARAHGLKMKPDCVYVREQFDEDASLADLRAD